MANKTTKAAATKSPKGNRPAAKAAAIPASTQSADPSAAQVRQWWPTDRAKRILSIMRTDDISYARAVKRSRRRMIGEGAWN